LKGCHFLNNRSKALRAASGEPGESIVGPGGGAAALPSRATVTRGWNKAHSLALSFSGIRTGIGFKHWNRVDDSKCAHCLQQCSSALHFGQVPFQAIPLGNCVAQLKQRAAVTGCTSRGRRGPVMSMDGFGPWGLGLSSPRRSLKSDRSESR